MGDLEDGPDQRPLEDGEVRERVMSLLPPLTYDLILTHGLLGEYTRHRRHEETARAVVDLWAGGALRAVSLWCFAYEDGNGAHDPRPVEEADEKVRLSPSVFETKVRLVTEVYGFREGSFEYRAAGRTEAFWCFRIPRQVHG
jgi:hypothetical protein